MENVHYYSVDVNWANDRKGVMHSKVLNDSIEVATPPEFNGGIPGVWSPEHLLVAAVDSCLMTTFLAIAENSKLAFISFESHAKGKLEKIEGKYLISEIELTPVVTVAAGTDPEKVLRVLHKSEAACLISNSIKATIVFNPLVKIQG